MCRAKDDPRGGWRCVPSNSFYKAYRGHHDEKDFGVGHGAFWMSGDIPSIADIQNAVVDARRRNLNKALALEDVAHVGHMIALHSDANIHNFSGRLASTQQDAFAHREAWVDGVISEGELRKKYVKVMDASLSLGCDVRESLGETLRKVRSFEGLNPVIDPFSARGNLGDSLQYGTIVAESGQFYPEQWKNAVAKRPVSVVEVHGNQLADYSPAKDQIRIGKDWRGTGKTSSRTIADAEKVESLFFEENKGDVMVLATHEYGHKFECSSSQLLALSTQFHMKRALVDPRSNDYLYLGSENSRNGKKYVDHFVNNYVGRFYEFNGKVFATEVFSTGMEHTFLGTEGSLIGLPTPFPKDNRAIHFFRADPEHRSFILGALACLDMPMLPKKK